MLGRGIRVFVSVIAAAVLAAVCFGYAAAGCCRKAVSDEVITSAVRSEDFQEAVLSVFAGQPFGYGPMSIDFGGVVEQLLQEEELPDYLADYALAVRDAFLYGKYRETAVPESLKQRIADEVSDRITDAADRSFTIGIEWLDRIKRGVMQTEIRRMVDEQWIPMLTESLRQPEKLCAQMPEMTAMLRRFVLWIQPTGTAILAGIALLCVLVLIVAHHKRPNRICLTVGIGAALGGLPALIFGLVLRFGDVIRLSVGLDPIVQTLFSVLRERGVFDSGLIWGGIFLAAGLLLIAFGILKMKTPSANGKKIHDENGGDIGWN